MAEIVYAEWRNQAEQVNYPFADEATLRNADDVTISRGLFVDARLYPLGGDESLYLRRISVDENRVRFYLALEGGTELAYGELDLLAVPANGEVPVLDLDGRPAGVLVSSQNDLESAAAAFERGDTVFPEDATRFAPSVVVPMPATGVRGFRTDDGGEVYGPVFLIGEQGIVLSVEDGAIRVDALGNPFARHEDCEEQDPLPSYCPIKTINQIGPDENGDFKLTVGGNSAVDNLFRVVQVEPGVLQVIPAKSLGAQSG